MCTALSARRFLTNRDQSALRAGDVVVVAPNHRQGVLGFLHPSSVAGVDKDVAVADVMSAVQWAHDHAKAFGADPNQLVLVGRGTGSYLLSAAARNMNNNVVRRAFYDGIVYGSFLPFDPAVPYLNLALALHCDDTDQSAWVSCFRAAPVDKLLQGAQASPHCPLPFTPYINVELLLAAPVATPRTIVAGANAADDKALFMERILPLAQVCSLKQVCADTVRSVLYDWYKRQGVQQDPPASVKG
ncbi:cholinesterase 1-like [Dermacentor silvarum]|uniref:cholinesterase 1-like n=1 Tax=Dermacentor silvarum TaxID=543639 RepID=UPI001897C48F|nr:cholinesterase 1-like [Dermacentor silvarum]